ncbi:hypothetical protein [Cryobacterium psychrophilum]|uniref:Septum formation-related domain-containing protein n=1 Tax=Cryobacterium psychrophilum TaxID=41988 RepID=A0A4Y8KJF3_9MICO|nr:hypothetical protein [Cryobacterium psychrophilum]TDW30076.1 hypothetical protein EDD25_1812 [Cryobacterium psychrophilum]TFD75999.1 hypothetical protein E3T53_14535 [Cryobacterium psychrophilum]
MPKDDESDHGIDWLASQFGERQNEPGTHSMPASSPADDEALVAPEPAASEPTEAPYAESLPGVDQNEREPAASDVSTVPVLPEPELPHLPSVSAASAESARTEIPHDPGAREPMAPDLPVTPEVPVAPIAPAAPDVAHESQVSPAAHAADVPTVPDVPAVLDVPEAPPTIEPVVPQSPRRTEADLEPEPWWTTPESQKTPQEFELGAALPAPLGAALPAPLGAEGAPASALSGAGNDDREASVPDARAGESLEHSDPAATVLPDPIADDAEEPVVPSRHSASSDPARTATRTVIWVGAVIVAIIILVGLFLLGQRLGSGGGPVALATPTATPTPSATPTPTPTPSPEVTAAQPAGVHAWNTLFGGECLEPYVSPWEETFTVSDCAAPHGAQLVYRGSFGGDVNAAFPGEAALAAQMNLLCTAPGALDLAAAGAYPDLQVQGSYPVTEEQWADSARNYYCFVSRSGGKPLTASVAGPGPAA